MRGYKAQGGDEAQEVKAALSGLDVPIFLGKDRFESAHSALKAAAMWCCSTTVFQHWRLKRDLDIVLIDATDPFGGGHVLPRGRLREPVGGLARAGVIAITRGENADPKIEAAIKRLAPDAPIFHARHAPAGARAVGKNEPWPLEKLRGLRAAATCGIGNPRAFWTTLEEVGVNILDRKIFADHHQFSAGDLQRWSNGRAKKRRMRCS